MKGKGTGFQEAKRQKLTLGEYRRVKSLRGPQELGEAGKGKRRVHLLFFPMRSSRTHTSISNIIGLVFLSPGEGSLFPEGRDACSKCHMQWESRQDRT